MKKNAFSLFELVLVITLLGILVTFAIPRIERDYIQEASEQVLSHIRYTQQLAIRDNKHRDDFNSKWQYSYWTWKYVICSNSDRVFYKITSDIDLNGGDSRNESAINFLTGKHLYLPNEYCSNGIVPNTDSPDIDLYDKFGVQDISGQGGCLSHQYIAFDFLGRPHTGSLSNINTPIFKNMMKEDCNLTFSFSHTDKNFSIIIKSETGYSYIEGQDHS